MKNANINVIIPSYNESKNVPAVIRGIRNEFPEVRIIFVDDSNKAENKKLKDVISKFENTDLITRGKKLGRGSAVMDGFKFGLKYKKAQYFYEMDSDLAHEPTHLKRFLQKIKETNAGLVIGSRYMTGGRVVGVSISRRILSRIINRFLRIMLGFKLTDYTSGYRLYGRSAVEFLVKSKLKSTGFIALSEISYKLHKNKFMIKEVPVTISTRKFGRSTMGIKELLNSLIFVIKMKFEEEILNMFYAKHSHYKK